MWPVTQLFLDTLAKPHTQRCFIQIIKDGKVTATQIGGSITDAASGNPLYLVDGSVQVDKTTIRRSAGLDLADPSGLLIPENVEDLLAPYVTEIRPWIGVRYWNAPIP